MAPSLAVANLVQNPGFESGLTNWTVNTSASDPWEVDSSAHGNLPFAGTFFASTGCVGSQCITGTTTQQASISQTLSTTIGQAYTLTFWFWTGGNVNSPNGTANELEILWNGSVVSDDGPNGTLGPIVNTTTQPYVQFTVSLPAATSTSTVLAFLGRQDPGWDALDNVDVETASATPEPSTLLIFTGALPLLWAIRRRRA